MLPNIDHHIEQQDKDGDSEFTSWDQAGAIKAC